MSYSHRPYQQQQTLAPESDRDNSGEPEDRVAAARASASQIGHQLGVQLKPAAISTDQERAQRLSAVQARQAFGSESLGDTEGLREAAAAGVEGPCQTLPHADAIQSSFGKHSVGAIQAHVGGDATGATKAMGAEAFAMGDHVAFGESPDLHTAAHEAAHVVQQRAGVQRKGGVGEATDRYEQHADAVADAVTRGDSAEQLLSDGPAGGGGAPGVQQKKDKNEPTPPDVKPPAATTADEELKEAPKAGATAKRSEGETAEMEKHLDMAQIKFGYTCMQQKVAVEELKQDKDASDPPPLWKSLLKGAVEIALAGGLGAIGKMVEIGMTAKLANAAKLANTATTDAGKVAAKVMASSAQAFAKEAVGKSVDGSAEGSKASKHAFWTSQKSALIDTAKKQEEDFVEQKPAIRAAADGSAQAKALALSLEQAYQEAKPIQRTKTLDEWCNVIASSDLGGSANAPNVRKHLGDSSLTGVLGINIRVQEPGSKPWITSAEIEGLNSQLRGELEQRPLKDLRITKNIHADLPGDNFNFALYPNGTIDWQRMSKQAGEWLEKHAVLRGKYNNGLEGARALIEDDLADEKIRNLKG